MHIRPLDIDSDVDLARAHAADAAAKAPGRPYATTWSLPELTATLRTPQSTQARELVVAEHAGRTIGLGDLGLPLTDNLHLATMNVTVHPDHRRRGVGTALLGRLRAGAEAAGRRLATAWVPGQQLAPDGAPLGAPPGSSAFAARCGLTERNTDVHRVLTLPVNPADLDRLAGRAAAYHHGYRLVAFTGACPAEHVDAYCRLKAAMITEAPMGDLEMDPEVWDEPRPREEEAELEAMQRTRMSAFALAPDGEVAGFNELLHAAHDVGNAFNWDTLVVRAHRGHRLGMALKVANLRRFQAAFPDVRRLHTHNAVQNRPMVAVNDALGFFPVERVGEWQGDVACLPRGAS